MLYCYNLTTGNLEYGIQASSSGAVRAITMVDNHVVACGEDGNVLIYEY